MSGVVNNLDTGQAASRDDPSLIAVEVAFFSGRPSGALRLLLTLNRVSRTVDIKKEDDLVRWSGSIQFPVLSAVRVCVQYHNLPFSFIWKDFACIEAPLSTGLLTVSDLTQRISVTFILFKPVSLPSNISMPNEAAEEQLAILPVKKQVLEVFTSVRSVVARLESETLSDVIRSAVDRTMSAVVSLTVACEEQEGLCDKTLGMVALFKPFLKSVEQHLEEIKQRAETRRAVKVMLELITNAFEYMKQDMPQYQQQCNPEDRYQRKLAEIKTRLARAQKAFDCSTAPESFKAIAAIDPQPNPMIEWLRSHRDLLYRTNNTCLEGTRVDLLKRIMNWIVNDTDTQPNLLWVRGKAGSGKTTLANTVLVRARDLGHHISYFFCKFDDQAQSDPYRLLPTLALQFAYQHESYRAAIFYLFQADPRFAATAARELDAQLEGLFKRPLEQTVDPLRPHVVVIDALDASGSSKERKRLAYHLLAMSRLVPWIKVLVVSRDEPTISDIFSSSSHVQYNISEEKYIHSDIRRYILSETQYHEIEVSDEDLEWLIQSSEGLFVWCHSVLRYLSDSWSRVVTKLSPSERQDRWSEMVYPMYEHVLRSAAETAGNRKDWSFLVTVLGIISVAGNNRPLSGKTIASFMLYWDQPRVRDRDCNPERERQRAQELQHTEQQVQHAICPYHSSFYDFLRLETAGASEERRTSEEWGTSAAIHSRTFQRCMDILDTQLRFNICEITIPVLNKDVPGLAERMSKNMSEALQYSSCFWFIHLRHSDLTPSDAASDVSALLRSPKLLFWLECLSLQGALAQSLLAFRQCMRFFQTSHPDIAAAADDARKFVTTFSKAMDSIPHIYLSSLFWLPSNSATHRNLELSQLKPLPIIENKRNTWDAIVREQSADEELYAVAFSPDAQYIVSGATNGRMRIWNAQSGATEREVLHDRNSAILALAYSPNGRSIVSGASNGTIGIRDVESGKLYLGPLTGHTSDVTCVAYSPTEQLILSGSNDATIRVWSTENGDQVGESLRVHNGAVWAVTYSPGGDYIASGGDDCDVHVCRTATYEEIGKAFSGHHGAIRSVEFSPCGNHIISGSDDCTVRVWDAHRGTAIGQPLRGHKDCVRCAIYSPNGRLIASSSDDCTVRIWDSESGAPVVELQGHSHSIRSLSFSSDGLFLASASRDTTIRIWDADFDSGTQVPKQSQSPGAPVLALACSPDSRRIAAGSEDTFIRLWDADTGEPIGEPLQGHAKRIRSVSFSPNGQFIVSGSDDTHVRIWDAQRGKAIMGPLLGHYDCIWSVACSPDSCYIASASSDGTVRLWDAQTGHAIGHHLHYHSDGAYSVAFSPDGQSLVCGSGSGTIFAWDMSAGVHSEAPMRQILRGHSGTVSAVEFSPDGRSIVSGSWDCTVRIWDAQSGELSGCPLEGHTGPVLCVALSCDGRYIASGSADWTVRIWDVQIGQAIRDPLQGHISWVWSVAFSSDPDNCFLSSAGWDTRINVYNLFSEQRLDEERSRWLECCSRMDEQDGWIRDGDALLLWVPRSYRPMLRSYARFMISNHGVTAVSVDFETLFRYSGENWVNILTDR